MSEERGWKWWLVAILIVVICLIVVVLIVGSYYIGYRNGSSNMSPPSTKFCSKGEAECRRVLEKYYGKPFPNVRPNWLKNPETNRNLELDCYNEELKLAVEYDGVQHFKVTSLGCKEKLEEQQRRDKLKDKLCKKNGVVLIRVPYTVKIKEIESYLLKRIPSKPSFCNLL